MANKQMHHLKVGGNIFEIVDSVARSGISGAPTIVSLSSAMSDTSKLYLYIGSETGYTSGDWYYYNGTSWVSGGQYGDMQLDTSLTASGMAADAKSVGDRFNSFATTATAGQAPIADGAGGWTWGDVATSGVPTEVRQALFTLLNNAVYRDTDLQDEKAIIQSWATEITAISVSPTTLSISGSAQSTITAVTSPAGGAVTWSSSDETVATVSGGVVTPTGINGTCTITASCGGKSASCAVTVSGFATLVSISAVYTQSGTVYDTDTLDSLKADLVVTANYDDQTSRTVTDYTLQGTLTEGTSTIVVAYGGKTTTFDVTVSGLLPSEYQLVEYIKSTGTQYIVTDLTINSSANASTNSIKDYSFDIDFAFDEWQTAKGTNIIIGVGDSGGCWVGYNNTVTQIALGTQSGMYYTSGSATARHQYTFAYSGTTATLTRDDGVQISRANALTANTLNLMLFATKAYGGSVDSGFAFNGKLYSCVVQKSGTEVLNLYPCYRKADGEIGLYDTVNSRFYTNDGTGTFQKGANV